MVLTDWNRSRSRRSSGVNPFAPLPLAFSPMKSPRDKEADPAACPGGRLGQGSPATPDPAMTLPQMQAPRFGEGEGIACCMNPLCACLHTPPSVLPVV